LPTTHTLVAIVHPYESEVERLQPIIDASQGGQIVQVTDRRLCDKPQEMEAVVATLTDDLL
jgi:hypothetical protein